VAAGKLLNRVSVQLMSPNLGLRHRVAAVFVMVAIVAIGTAGIAQAGDIFEYDVVACDDIHAMWVQPVRIDNQSPRVAYYYSVSPANAAGSPSFQQSVARPCTGTFLQLVEGTATTSLGLGSSDLCDYDPEGGTLFISCWNYYPLVGGGTWPIFFGVFSKTHAGLYGQTQPSYGVKTSVASEFNFPNVVRGSWLQWTVAEGKTYSDYCPGCGPHPLMFPPGIEPDWDLINGVEPTAPGIVFPNEDTSGSGCSTFDLGCWFSFLFVPDSSAWTSTAQSFYTASEDRFPVGMVIDAIDSAGIIFYGINSALGNDVCTNLITRPGFGAEIGGTDFAVFAPNPCDLEDRAAQMWGFKTPVRALLTVSMFVTFAMTVIKRWWPTGLEGAVPGSDAE